MSRVFSVVQFFPDDSGHKCGYCLSENGSISNGLWAHVLHVDDYQLLVDSGWRRSGKYCYRPVMSRTCCPLYTIRCDAVNFKPSKSQKKVLRRFRNFLMNVKDSQNLTVPSKGGAGSGSVDSEEIGGDRVSGLAVATTLAADVVIETPQDLHCVQSPIAATSSHPRLETNTITPADAEHGSGQMKKKLLRRLRWQQKHPNQQFECGQRAPEQPLEQLLRLPDLCRHRLQLRLVAVQPSEEYNSSRMASFRLYRQYQMTVHKESEDKCGLDNYERFLCSSPFKGGAPYGAFHHQYWLDGRLVAVGVLDILPAGVSSKYFFYDPSLSHLSLGTYASLRELELTRTLCATTAAIRHYYMGYYIHGCSKMRYKAQYRPSWLLCPESLTWCPVDRCLPLLDAKPYCRLAPQRATGAEDPACGSTSLAPVCVLFRGSPMSFSEYERTRPGLSSVGDEERQEMQLFVRLVGPAVAKHMLLYRH